MKKTFLIFALFSLLSSLCEANATPVFDALGRWNVSTIESFPDQGGEVTTMCSLIARKNLESMLGVTRHPNQSIVQGNATNLIIDGIKDNTLQPLRSKKTLLEKIKTESKKTGETIFDLYEWRPKTAKIGGKNDRLMLPSQRIEAGHRVVVFLGTDNEWYVMDPIRSILGTKPERLKKYIPEDFGVNTWYIRLPGYHVWDILTHDELKRALPFLSEEVQEFLGKIVIVSVIPA